MRGALAVAMAVWATLPALAWGGTSVPPGMTQLSDTNTHTGAYLRGKTYATGLRFKNQTVLNYISGDRFTDAMSPGLTPLSVDVLDGAGAIVATFDVSGKTPCVNRASISAQCSVTVSGSATVREIDLVLRGGTSIDVDFIPVNTIQPTTTFEARVRFRVEPTASGPTQDFFEIVSSGTYGGKGSGAWVDESAAGDTATPPAVLSHAINDPMVTTLSLSPSPSQIGRGQTATFTATAFDQEGGAMSASATSFALSEHLQSTGGPVVPPGSMGQLTGSGDARAYTPNTAPRADSVFATVTATNGVASAQATVEVRVSPIANLSLAPASAALAPGQSQGFTPSAQNAFGGAELVSAADVSFAIAPSTVGTVDAAGLVTVATGRRASAQNATLTATLKANPVVNGQANVLLLPTVLTACRLEADRTILGPSDVATLKLIGTGDGQDYDITAEAEGTATPVDAVQLQKASGGLQVLPRRSGLDVTVTALATACPGGQVTRALTLRPIVAGDLTGISFSESDVEMVVGGRHNVSAIGHYAQASDAPIVPQSWQLGPGLCFESALPGDLGPVCASSPARQAAGQAARGIGATASGESAVKIQYGALEATLPVKVDENYLTLGLKISTARVRQGQPVAAELTVTGRATAPHAGVHIQMALPRGLAVVGKAPDYRLDIPAGPSEQKFNFVMLAAARSGRLAIKAQGYDASLPGTAIAQAQTDVVILADPEFSEALLVGRVFDDLNKNGRMDAGEPGIGGAIVGLSSGVFIKTDVLGNYHAQALIPGSVLVKLDRHSLPHLAPLSTPERVALTLTPGEVARVDFGVKLDEPRAPRVERDQTRPPRFEGAGVYVLPLVVRDPDTEKTLERREVRVPLAGVRNEQTLTAASANGTVGHYRVLVRRYAQEGGELLLADEVRLERQEFPPQSRSSHFVSALGEGLIAFDPKDKTWDWGGQVSAAYRGVINDKYRISAGVDTRLKTLASFFQRDPTRVFRNLDPESYAPTYGDASELTDEHEGGQRLYARVDAGPFMAKYGSFLTGLHATDYGRYDRALTGAAARLDWREGPGRAHQATAFYAKADTRRVHDELLSTGSTLFYLSNKNLVEGSEQIYAERRAQRVGLLRERVPLKPGIDYQIDYLAGRILLTKPLLTGVSSESSFRQGAQDTDEQWLLVDYEVQIDLAQVGTGSVIGGRVAERPWRGLELGVTGATEIRPGDDYRLYGADATLALGKAFVWRGEYAHSESAMSDRARSLDGGYHYDSLPDLTQKGGDAYSSRLSFDAGGARGEAYGKLRTRGFNDTASAPGERLSQVGAALKSPSFSGFGVSAAFDDTRREAASRDQPALRLGRQMYELQASEVLGPVTLLAGGRYAQLAPGFGVGQEAVASAGVLWRVIPQLTIGATHQEPLYRRGERPFDALGRDTQLHAKAKLFDRLGAEGAVGYGERGPSAKATLLFPLAFDTEMTVGLVHGGALVQDALSIGARRQIGDGTLAYVDNQLTSPQAQGTQSQGTQSQGTQSQGTLETHAGGVETKIGAAHLVSLSFESGSRNAGVALGAVIRRTGGGIGYAFLGKQFQLRARLEGRLDTVDLGPTRYAGGDVRGDWRVSDTLSMAAWVKAHSTVFAQGKQLPIADDVEAALGLAYRPQVALHPIVLARYALTHERLPREKNPLGAVTDAHVASVAALIDPWRYVGFMAKVAGRAGVLRIPGIGSTDLLSVLALPRVNGHLTKIFDLSAEYRYCLDRGIGAQHGALFEASALVATFFRIGVGYNFSQINDVTADCRAQDAKGVFLRAQALY